MYWHDVNLRNSIYYSRYKYKMLSDLQKLYKKYLAGDLGGDQQPPKESAPPCGSTFCEEFEDKWFSLNAYVSQFGETFEQQWFIDNNYINDYEEEFEIEWFVDNNYIIQDTENFEGGDWDE